MYWRALLLIAPSIAIGTHARVALIPHEYPHTGVFDMAAADFEYSRDQLAYLFSLEEHSQFADADPHGAAFHAFGVGWAEAKQTLDREPEAQITPPTASHFAAIEGTSAALLAQLDGDEQAGIQVTSRLLKRLSGFSADEERAIIAAAAWRRDWIRSLPEHGPDRVAKWHSRIAGLDPIAQEGLTEALGRRWAHDTIRWRQTEKVRTPSISGLPRNLVNAFWAGFAEGVGERLGPRGNDAVKPPEATTWRERLLRGQQRRWLSQSR